MASEAEGRLALRVHFQHRNDVYVAGNMFIYDEEGNPQSSVAPDVFVVFGAPAHTRDSYFLWLEPKGPDFVMERENHITCFHLFMTSRTPQSGSERDTTDTLDPIEMGIVAQHG